VPTLEPTGGPTYLPTSRPTGGPTNTPTLGPTNGPTNTPTPEPTLGLTPEPTGGPTEAPTSRPTGGPSNGPTYVTTAGPTEAPTPRPTGGPTSALNPTANPTSSPTREPTSGSTSAPTGTPSTSPAAGLPPLVTVLFNDGELEACQGDCQSDSDCATGLMCYQRAANETVPGCSGLGEEKQDYCCDLPPNYLVYIQKNPPINTTYDACQGDCDNDDECTGDLVCEQRSTGPVPGCDGSGRNGADYCRYPDPSMSPSTLPSSTSSPSPPPFRRDFNYETANPTHRPTSSPNNSPSSAAPTTSAPIGKKFNFASDSPTVFYGYTNLGTVCPHLNEPNYQGPFPQASKSNVALQFFAYGDTPYDGGRNGKTCIAEDGVTEEEVCTRFDCSLDNISMSELPVNNTCTYKGKEYECNRDILIPYMNSEIAAGEAAFVMHCGDLFKGSAISNNRRCQPHSLKGRQELFANATNFLIVPGDNEWNECYGYDPSSNDGDLRDLWRQYFALDPPFNQFSAPFPRGDTPTLHRKTTPNAGGDVNPELLYFETNDIAIFGLNYVTGEAYINTTTINEEWVEWGLNNSGCSLKSIILFSQRPPNQSIYDKVDEYIDSCGGTSVPLLTISGDIHPSNYCMTKTSPDRIHLTIEAFRSGPIYVSVVRDPTGVNGDFFHASDTQEESGNHRCPDLDLE